MHYIGEMGKQTIMKTMFDQLTDGQLEWTPMAKNYDVISIGLGEDNRRYDVVPGEAEWRETLRKQFPEEHEAIDRFLEMLRKTETFHMTIGFIVLKNIPYFLSWLAYKTGIVDRFWPQFTS